MLPAKNSVRIAERQYRLRAFPQQPAARPLRPSAPIVENRAHRANVSALTVAPSLAQPLSHRPRPAAIFQLTNRLRSIHRSSPIHRSIANRTTHNSSRTANRSTRSSLSMDKQTIRHNNHTRKRLIHHSPTASPNIHSNRRMGSLSTPRDRWAISLNP